MIRVYCKERVLPVIMEYSPLFLLPCNGANVYSTACHYTPSEVTCRNESCPSLQHARPCPPRAFGGAPVLMRACCMRAELCVRVCGRRRCRGSNASLPRTAAHTRAMLQGGARRSRAHKLDPPLSAVAAASTSSELVAPPPKAGSKPRRNPRRRGIKGVRFAEESHVLEMAEQTRRKVAKERRDAARAAWLRGSPRDATGDVLAWWARWTSLYLLSDEQEAKQDELHERRYLRLRQKEEQEQAVVNLSKDVLSASWETTWSLAWRGGGDSDEDPLPYCARQETARSEGGRVGGGGVYVGLL